MQFLFGKKAGFYKGNLHCHTVFSDGHKTPEEIKELYMSKGYSFVAYTDHEHIINQSHLTDENFVALVGCEVAIKEFPNLSTMVKRDMKVTHLNFYSLDPTVDVTPCYSSVYDNKIKDFFRDQIKYEEDCDRPYTVECINSLIETVKSKGFLVSYNHPTWSLETALDYVNYKNLDFVEIYNHSCYANGLAIDDEHVFSEMLSLGNKLYCTAADDNHNPNTGKKDTAGGWVVINSDKLDYASIMNALQSGEFYASTGPEIYEITRDGNRVTIKCSDCEKIILMTGIRRYAAVYSEDGKSVNEATFEVMEEDKYFRLKVTDKSGKNAYSQAFEF